LITSHVETDNSRVEGQARPSGLEALRTAASYVIWIIQSGCRLHISEQSQKRKARLATVQSDGSSILPRPVNAPDVIADDRAVFNELEIPREQLPN
jgi:hypothetical protein